MKPEDAEEYTQALGQVVAGGWRQIALGQRLGVPKALGLTIEDWVQQRLGGYVQYSIAERRPVIAELKTEGRPNTEIAAIVGVNEKTVRNDLRALSENSEHSPGAAPKSSKRSQKPVDESESSEPINALMALGADDALRREIDREHRRDQRQADRQAQRAAAAQDAKQTNADADVAIRHESLDVTAASMAPGSVALVFTDPPYHDKTLPVYNALGLAAARVLKDGGSLITYTSHHRMPEVIGMLQAAGLTFFWPLAAVYLSGDLARMTEYGIVVHWKPLLWFVKGAFRSRDDMRFVHDLIDSPKEPKAHHPWQQGTTEARFYIEALTQPGDIVFDPFCGGGTTAVAAAQTGRRYLTCDVDEEAVWIARQRLREAMPT